MKKDEEKASRILAEEKSQKKPAGGVRKLAGAIDKNGNGRIDLGDFGIEESNIAEAKEKAAKMASKAGEAIKAGSEIAVRVFDNAKIEMDRKNLRPVFKNELFAPASSEELFDAAKSIQNFSMVCIVERDKKRGEAEACKGSIGYVTTVKGMDILNIYKDKAHGLGLQFYPSISRTIYYEDPFRTNFYISLDDYFDYFKKARVSELSMIAKKLGAKHVKITLNEHKKTFVATKGKVTNKAKVKSLKEDADVSYEKGDSEYASVEIADDEMFNGTVTPEQPELVYFKNEGYIQELIKKCMDSSNPMKSVERSFKCSKTSGINVREALKIDAVLEEMDCSGTASISSEAQREGRTDFQFSIEFPARGSETGH